MMQEFMDELEGMASDKVNEIHTAMVGKIVSFDASKCRATIQPYGKYVVGEGEDEEALDYPLLTDVPAVIPGCRDVGIAYPVKKGEDVIIIVSENDYDEWLNGTDADGPTRFDLSNSFFICGALKKGNSLLTEACSSNAVVVRNGATKLKVESSGVTIKGHVSVEGTVSVNGSITASGTVTASNIV